MSGNQPFIDFFFEEKPFFLPHQLESCHLCQGVPFRDVNNWLLLSLSLDSFSLSNLVFLFIVFFADLPINYNQVYTGQPDGQTEGGATTGGGGLLPGQVTPRRSLSQSLLSQMSSPTMGFGLTARSPSPSSLISNALRRTPSFNRPGFMSRGPSLQSLVKSFINRVSRGTQTDSDDNDFDQVSIASVNSGFSAVAGDLTRSRLKLFLNDNQPRHIKSYASSQVDNESFLEELQNLRDEIHGEFGSEPEPVYTDNQFEIDELAEESESVSVYVTEKESSRESQAAVHKVLTCDREAETDAIDAKDCTTQTEVPKKVQRAEKAIETDPVVALPVPQVKEMVTQTIEILSPVAVVTVPPKPKMSDGETQTDLLKFCEHCSRIQLANSHDSAPPSKIIHEIVVQQPQPQILKNCEFIISVRQHHLSLPMASIILLTFSTRI